MKERTVLLYLSLIFVFCNVGYCAAVDDANVALPLITYGDCCRDKESDCVDLSVAYQTYQSPIASISHLDSLGFTGMIIHENPVFDFIDCNGRIRTSNKNNNNNFKVLGANAVVLDEQPVVGTVPQRYLTIIAIRYVGMNLENGLPGVLESGIAFAAITWDHPSTTINGLWIFRAVDKFPLDPRRPSSLDVKVGPGNRLYYFVRDEKEPQKLVIRWAQQLDYAFFNSNPVIKALTSSTADNPRLPLSEFEALVTTASSKPDYYVYFTLCDCRLASCDCKLAVSFEDGFIDIYCCEDLRRLHCTIRAPCSCECNSPIPWYMKWCCDTKTLFVLYRKNRKHSNGRSFIRAYKVDFDPESRGKCYKHLYTIKGCNIDNFRVCCEGECPVVFVTIYGPDRKFYLRTYVDGKPRATAVLPYAIPRGLMALSGRPTRKEWHDGSDMPNNLRRCKCCDHCGVFIPFLVLGQGERPDDLALSHYQPVGCFCAKL